MLRGSLTQALLGTPWLLLVAARAATLHLSVQGQDIGGCQDRACASLSYAMSQAADKDVIMVGPGTYSGPGNRNLDTGGKADLTIASTHGRDATVFDLQYQGRFFGLDAAAGATVIQGFTLLRGNCSAIPLKADDKANGAGFRFVGSKAVVRNVAIRYMDCTTEGVVYTSFSGAAFCFIDSEVLVEDALVEDNIANHGAGASSWGSDRSVVRDSVFLRSRCTYWGGAMLMEENSTTEWHNCRFSYGKCDYGGGLDDGAAASPLYKNVTFEYFEGRYGSAVYHYGYSQTRYEDVVIQHNVGLSGSVYINAGTLPTFKNVTFFNNSVDAQGGAFRSYYDGRRPLLIDRVRFIRNRAGDLGGAILMAPTADVIFSGCEFDGNTAASDGAAIHVLGYTPAPRPVVLALLNTTFVRNRAGADGGALATGGPISVVGRVEDCAFRENSGRDGGAVFLSTPGAFNFTRTEFRANQAYLSGGAIKVKNLGQEPAEYRLVEVALVANSAVTTGGGLSCEEPAVVPPPPATTLVLDGFRVAGAQVVQDGGGLHVDCTSVHLRNGVLEGNRAVEGNGGALLVTKAVACGGSTPEAPIFDDVALRGNSAGGGGGGVYFDHLGPECRMPFAAADPAFAWRWHSAAAAAAATLNNSAGFGDLQATMPARIVLACAPGSAAASGCADAPAGSNVSLSIPGAYPGIQLALTVSMRDDFGQKVTSSQLQVAVSLDDGDYRLQGVRRHWFENGEASVSEVSVVGGPGDGEGTSSVVVHIGIPQAIAAALGLSGMAPAHVLLRMGPCPAGVIRAVSAQGEQTCASCPTGRFALALAAACSSCEAGSFADRAGSSACSRCPLGHRCPPGTTSPLPCPPGSYQAAGGSDVCTHCELGRYQPTDQATACERCPLVQTTLTIAAQSGEQCVCPEGFYGNETCAACSRGMDCPAWSPAPQQLDGFYLMPARTGGFEAYRCSPMDCRAGAAGQCAEGRQGFACAECLLDHFPTRSGTCSPCRVKQAAVPVAVSLACLAAFGFLYLLAGANVNRQSFTQLTVLATGGQLLVTVQTIASLNSLQVIWIEPMSTIMEGLSVLRLKIDVLQVQCIFRTDNPVAKYGMTLLAVPGLCALLLTMFAAMAVVFRRPVGVNGVVNSLGLLITTCYLPITIVCFSSLPCVSNPNGTSAIATIPSILCGSNEQRLMLAMGIVNLLVVPVPILCGVSLLTYAYPSIVANGGASTLLQRFRFLYQRFAPQKYYYAVLYLYRSFLVALPPVVFPEPGAIQIFVLAAIIAGFMVLQCVVWPWRTTLSNVLDSVFGYVLILVLVATAGLVQAPAGKLARDMTIFFYCVVGFLVVATAAVVGMCFWRLVRRHDKKYGIFLSHHKSGAAALARLMKCYLESAACCTVFLDSDHLESLDSLFDIVRVDTELLVVILTVETLRRPWCAGELVTAHQAKVPIILMSRSGYEGLNDDAIFGVDTFWTPDEMLPLTVAGITYDSVRKCYLHLRTLQHIEIPAEISSEGDFTSMREAVGKVAKHCSTAATPVIRRISAGGHVLGVGVSDAGVVPSGDSVNIGIVVDSADMEAGCCAAVLRQFMMAQTQWESQIFFAAQEVTSSHRRPSVVVVLLTKGCLRSLRFAALLVAVRQTWTDVSMVTVLADSHFIFPPKSMLAADVIIPVSEALCYPGAVVAEAYGQVLNVLALPFFVEGNTFAIKLAAARISERIASRMSPDFSEETDRASCRGVLCAGSVFGRQSGVEDLLLAQARRGARRHPEAMTAILMKGEGGSAVEARASSGSFKSMGEEETFEALGIEAAMGACFSTLGGGTAGALAEALGIEAAMGACFSTLGGTIADARDDAGNVAMGKALERL